MSPSPFIVEWLERIARERGPSTRLGAGTDRRALDVAMGRGRHAVALARAGFRAFGVDVKLEAVREAVAAGAAENVRVLGWCADLTQHPLPRRRFDLVVVSRYLQRDLFPALEETLAPRGVVIYETFTTHQRALGRPPTSPDHLLEPGELRRRFEGFEVLFYEEVLAPDAVARIVAQSRG
jgi:tellurite methyltransferase